MKPAITLALVVSGALLAPADAHAQARRKVIIDHDCRGPATTDLLSILALIQSSDTGGGIPVVRGPKKVRRGVEAVIDKDLTSALMANVLGIDVMMILTGVSRVAINYRTPRQRELDRVMLSEARRYLAEGQFPVGSMGPKVEAAIRFLERGGRHAVIGHLQEALPALRGETGTHIVPYES